MQFTCGRRVRARRIVNKYQCNIVYIIILYIVLQCVRVCRLQWAADEKGNGKCRPSSKHSALSYRNPVSGYNTDRKVSYGRGRRAKSRSVTLYIYIYIYCYFYYYYRTWRFKSLLPIAAKSGIIICLACRAIVSSTDFQVVDLRVGYITCKCQWYFFFFFVNPIDDY